MTDNGTTQSTLPDKDPAVPPQQEPDVPEPVEPAEDPGYLIRTGEAVGEDGSVVPIIGGLPAVEGSAWDIGAPADERGVDLAEE
jgi:hypothetical protein